MFDLFFSRHISLLSEFTAADVSRVYFSGLPVVRLAPVCSDMPSYIHSYNASSADFTRQPDSYMAYNISGEETLLLNQYGLLLLNDFQKSHLFFVVTNLEKCEGASRPS